MEEELFPSPVERTVASSLLLLSVLPPSLSEPDSAVSKKSIRLSNSKSCSSFFLHELSEKNVRISNSKSSSYLLNLNNGSKRFKGLSNPKWSSCYSILKDGLEKSKGLSKPKWNSNIAKIEDDSENSVELSNSKSSSCLSSLTRDDGSSLDACTRRLRMVTVVSRDHEMKFKAAKRTRTPIMRLSNDHTKLIPANKIKSELSTTSAEASSCISSGSSGDGVVVSSSLKPNPAVNSASIRTRAEGILRILSYGCASEVRIRQVLGDSPDTSKALRMLLRKEHIRRSGIGGRCDPFIYKVA